jgi:hypothetical protein
MKETIAELETQMTLTYPTKGRGVCVTWSDTTRPPGGLEGVARHTAALRVEQGMNL